MVEMEMENKRVERLRWQQWGENWIRAISDGNLDHLEQFCHSDVSSQLLTAKRFVTLNNAVELVAKFRQWFGECSNFQLEASRIGQVGRRLGIFYRFRLLEQGDWFVVEQQLYCTIKDGRVETLHLLCSGFQLAGVANQATAGTAPGSETQSSIGDALLEFYTGASEAGSTCAVLTPAIRSKLREMQSGQVLEVRVDDPSARGDIEAWSRLSSNELLRVEDQEGQVLRFFLKKK